MTSKFPIPAANLGTACRFVFASFAATAGRGQVDRSVGPRGPEVPALACRSYVAIGRVGRVICARITTQSVAPCEPGMSIGPKQDQDTARNECEKRKKEE